MITTEDGLEVMAKIPSPNAERAVYSTASEAAVLQYGVKSFLISYAGLRLTFSGSSKLSYNNIRF